MNPLVLTAGLALLTSCAPKPSLQSTPSRPPRARPDRAPAADSVPAAVRLQRLVRALKALPRGKPVDLPALFKKHVPTLEEGKGFELPDRGTVRLFEVTVPHLYVVLVKVFPPGLNPEDAPVFALFTRKRAGQSRVTAVTISGTGDPTKVFEATNPVVVAPPRADHVPVFHLRYDYRPPKNPRRPNRPEGRLAEVYVLAKDELRSLGEFPLYTSQGGAAKHKVVYTKLVWIRGKEPRTAYLARTQLRIETVYPCTAVPNEKSKACKPEVECTRTSTVVAKVTPKGAETLTASQIRTLRQTLPALAKLPADEGGQSDAKCKRLAN